MAGTLSLAARNPGLEWTEDGSSTDVLLIDADTGEYVGPIADGLIDSDALNPNLIQYAEVTLSNAQLLALFTTPVALVAAQGANTVVELCSLTLRYNYATAAFTIGSATNLQVKYTNGSGAAASATAAVTGFLDQSANEYRILPQNSSSIEPVANAAIVLTLAGANVTVGGGTVTAQIAYRVHSFA